MRVAVIDLGTNTFNLLVAEIKENGLYQILFTEELCVKLGEGSIQKKVISPLPFQRGIKAFKKHVKTAKSFQVESIEAYATSAIRSAENGNIFIDTLLGETGIKINVIDGNREAELIYKGVSLALKYRTDGNYLIMDIGGGSTEFILCDSSGILWKKSFDLGVARLLNHISPDDPVSEKNISDIVNFLEDNLSELFYQTSNYKISSLVGCSGSFESFASMIFHNFEATKDPYSENPFNIDLSNFEKIYHCLVRSDINQRYQLKGLVRMRADTIVLACIFVSYLLIKLKPGSLLLSHFALKEGVLSEFISNNETKQ